MPRKRYKPAYGTGKRVLVYNPCVPSLRGLEGSSPDVILPPQILVHGTFLGIGCLERELCFKQEKQFLKSHVLPKARRRQHWAGSSFPLVFSH